MKRSVSTSSQDVGSGTSKRNASRQEEATAEDSSSQVTLSPKTALPPISESSVEHNNEYEQILLKMSSEINHQF